MTVDDDPMKPIGEGAVVRSGTSVADELLDIFARCIKRSRLPR